MANHDENFVRDRSSQGRAALLIIDVQVGLLRLIPSEIQSTVLPKIETLLFKARASGTPVIYIRHDGPKGHPLDSDMQESEIHPCVAPVEGDQIVRKRASDSFFNTTLQEELAKREIRHLIITGGMTEYCVDTTCRRATSLGYDVTLVADFGSKGGIFDHAGLDISMIQSAVMSTAKVLASARQNQIPIVYLKMGFRPDLSDLGASDSPNRTRHLYFGVGQTTSAPDGTEGRFLVRDTWNTNIISELKPHAEDRIMRGAWPSP